MNETTIHQDILQLQYSHQGRRLKMDYHFELIKEIDSLIYNGETSFSSLDANDKDTLTVLEMSHRKQNAYECITDCNDIHQLTNQLIKFIYSGTSESAYELAELMRENAHEFYASDLSKLFNDRLQVIECETKKEKGLIPIQHSDNGETTWIHR